jgi:adenylate cyclase
MAILFAANVVGSSSLTDAEEQGTFETLETHCRHFVYPKIAEHDGRIIRATRDNLLVEFASATEAVQCAVEMQRGIANGNIDIPPDRCLTLRVGIDQTTAIGSDLVSRAVAALPVDTIATLIKPGTVIHGDSGIIAMRLAALADPGGICISGTVWDAVRHQLPYTFEDSGKQDLEIRAAPLQCYTMRANALEKRARDATQEQGRSATQDDVSAPADSKSSLVLRLDLQSVVLTAAAVFTIAVWIAGGWAFFDSFHKLPPSNPTPASAERPASAVAEKSVSESPTREQPPATAKLAETIPAEAGVNNHPPKPPTPQPPVQADAAPPPQAAAPAVTPQNGEPADRQAAENPPVVEDIDTPDPAARELISQGWAAYYHPYSLARWQEARRDFEQALEIDPQSSAARIGLASILSTKLADGWSPALQEDLPRAEQLLLEAVDKGGVENRAAAHFALGVLRQMRNQLPEARKEFGMTISLDPSDARAHLHLGESLLYLGQPQAAIPSLEQAIRLRPDDPKIAITHWALGTSYLLLDQADQAVHPLEAARAANEQWWVPHFYLAAAYGLKGDLDSAKAALAASLKLKPALRSVARMRAENPWLGNPQYWALQEKTINVGLRRAGFPDQ